MFIFFRYFSETFSFNLKTNSFLWVLKQNINSSKDGYSYAASLISMLDCCKPTLIKIAMGIQFQLWKLRLELVSILTEIDWIWILKGSKGLKLKSFDF